MNKTIVSKEVYEGLIKHLTDIEEEKARILEKYYPIQTDERENFEKLMNRYIEEIKRCISNNDCPLVIIGSVVEVEDTEFNELEKYQIVSPFHEKTQLDLDCASYISPIGKALLLKKQNDEVHVETPMGKIKYLIKSIAMPKKISLPS